MLRNSLIAHLPERKLVSYIPDDAFYYLQLARNSASGLGWSFDGVETATGFHPLYAYLLKFIFYISPNLELKSLYLIIGFCASILISFSLYLNLKLCERFFGLRFAVFALIPYTSILVVSQSSAMMESWLVIFFSSAAYYSILCTSRLDISNKILAFLAYFCIGLAGSLSRTDFGLFLPILLMASFFLPPLKTYISRKKLSIIFAGAVIGLAIGALQTFAISGHLLQGSVEIKSYWSDLFGYNPRQASNIFFSLLNPIWPLTTKEFKVPVLIALTAIFFVRSRSGRIKLRDSLLLILGSVIVLIYILFYGFNSQGIQAWYCASLLTPVILILAALARMFMFKSAILMLVAITMVGINFRDNLNNFQAYSIQTKLYEAAKTLPKLLGDETIGSWNAGIVGYFSHNNIVNLDGLVNDSILPYVKSNNLLEYLRERNINFVVDFEAMIESKDMRLRGGYSHLNVTRCFVPISDPNFDYEGGWGSVQIWKVTAECGK